MVRVQNWFAWTYGEKPIPNKSWPTSVDRVYANKVVEDTLGLDISGSNPSLAG